MERGVADEAPGTIPTVPVPSPDRAAAIAGPTAVTDLPDRFRSHLERSRLIPRNSTVLAAVSGGLDSVVLLHLLRFTLPTWGLRLYAAHFDHAMRPDSAADADWVVGLCRAWEVPIVCGRAEEPLHGEAAARSARYRFLRNAWRRTGADRVATAHHADDQAETVLFRIIRGTGLRGLRGIAPRRGPLVRPLLPFTRAEIEGYAAAVGIRYRVDPTNLTVGYARNRLRHEILPRLERIAPHARAALARLAELAREEEAAWDSVLDRLEAEVVVSRRDDTFELARPVLLSYDPRVRARVIRRILRRLGSIPGWRGTTAAVEFTKSGTSGGGIQLAGGVRIEREFDRIRIHKVRPEAVPPATSEPAIIDAPGTGSAEAVLGGRTYSVRWEIAGAQPPGADTEAFGLDELTFPLVVRGWEPGDRIHLAYGSKKLKKLFGEKHVGRAERESIPILAELDGRVLWVKGVARAAVARPVPGRPILHITVTDAEFA